ncbi:SDR family NAD(P)-dependent oxidoreductase [Pseudactinotalea sp. HY158]|uniref:SDR family NAD(P)-dependent oxidoreductase n=1 Tax=Pseudactinotalea sp. HY158 TaxID=2654547 RepID=UPI00129C75A0|nr:SDR family oxidoreductase [Pseudactinotalea sp. HY158]QGH70357.1 SDR family oxidoreductase [Pseudactinotalea sp. HY158]
MDASRFAGRTAVVTGAAHGIGAATARRLTAEGARVVLADVDVGAARDVAADLPGAVVVECDMTETATVDCALIDAVAAVGALDFLVNVAGAARRGPSVAEGMTDEDWNWAVDLNLGGAMRLVRAGVPYLGDSGAIVFVSSVNGLAAFGEDAYSAAKAGLVSFARNLAAELGPRGIRANVVAPGTVRTRVWDEVGGPDPLIPLYPLGRLGEPEDIAAAIAFLLSEDASWITGITLPVDGGVLTGPRRTMDALRAEDAEGRS